MNQIVFHKYIGVVLKYIGIVFAEVQKYYLFWLAVLSLQEKCEQEDAGGKIEGGETVYPAF